MGEYLYNLEAQIEQLNAAVEAVKGRKIENVFFVACGGSKAIFMPVEYIFSLETEIPAKTYTAREFLVATPKALGPNSLVISCSHSGNTQETVESTQLAGIKGALTISFVHNAANKDQFPLWNKTQHGISYAWGPDTDAGFHNSGMLYRLVFNILNILNPNPKYEVAIAYCDKLDEVFKTNKAIYHDRAVEFGKRYKDSPLIYTMSSGPCYGLAYSFAICLLQEMQWVHSAAIHSGEFFHGPFEVMEKDVPIITIRNVGPTKALDDRALAFCNDGNDEIKEAFEEMIVIDCNEFDWCGLEDESLKDYFSVLIAGVVLRTYADTHAATSGHPLSVRRYMWRMNYAYPETQF